MIMKICLLLAMFGHMICGITDCLMTYTPNGKFQFSDMQDPKKMSNTFEGMSLKNLRISILLGVFALTLAFFGYLALGYWMSQFSEVYSKIMYISAILYVISIVAHHVCCGTVEWFFVRLGRTEEALNAVLDFFKQTSITMYTGYIGLLVFAVSFFIAVVTGNTSLPWWACIFNTFPLFIILAPFKIPAKGNIAGAIMFLGLLFMI